MLLFSPLFLLHFSLALCTCVSLNESVNNEITLENKSVKIASNCAKRILEGIKQDPEEKGPKVAVLFDLLPEVSVEVQSVKGYRFLTRSSNWYSDTMPVDAYVLAARCLYSIRDIINILRKDVYWNPRAIFLVAIQFVNDWKGLTKIFLDNNLHNAIVVTGNAKNQNVHVFDTEIDACNRPMHMITLCPCKDFVFYEIPDLRNNSLEGCELKLVSHEFYPYTTFSHGNFTGVEQFMIRIFDDKEGMQTELLQYTPSGDFGHIDENYTFSGMLTRIQSNEVEGAMGGFYMTIIRSRGLDFVYPFLVDNLRIITGISKPLRVWQGVIFKLSNIFFILLAIYFVTFLILIAKLEIFSKRDYIRDVLILWGYFLNNDNVNFIRKGDTHRIVVVNILLFVFMVNCIMQAALLSSTTSPIRIYPASEPEDVPTFYKLVTTASEYNTAPPEKRKKIHKVCETSYDCIKIIYESDELLYMHISDEALDHLSWHANNGSDPKSGLSEMPVRKLNKSLLSLLQTIYFRRGSTITYRFNKFVTRMAESGILTQYLRSLRFYTKLKSKHVDKKKKKLLDFVQFYDAYFVLFGGYFLATITLFGEILSNKLKTRRKRVLVNR